MDGRHWLDEVERLYREHKELSELAAAQVGDADFFRTLGGSSNSIAVLMKHVGRNHRSRWRDFLTTDGEKRDRNRDEEFRSEGETRATIHEAWEDGWRIALDGLRSLESADLARTITIRGEPHPVVRAIHRNVAHVVYHTGQIVQLARHLAGEEWKTLSVAPGKSEEHNRRMRERWGDWWASDFSPDSSRTP